MRGLFVVDLFDCSLPPFPLSGALVLVLMLPPKAAKFHMQKEEHVLWYKTWVMNCLLLCQMQYSKASLLDSRLMGQYIHKTGAGKGQPRGTQKYHKQAIFNLFDTRNILSQKVHQVFIALSILHDPGNLIFKIFSVHYQLIDIWLLINFLCFACTKWGGRFPGTNTDKPASIESVVVSCQNNMVCLWMDSVARTGMTDANIHGTGLSTYFKASSPASRVRAFARHQPEWRQKGQGGECLHRSRPCRNIKAAWFLASCEVAEPLYRIARSWCWLGVRLVLSEI